jgi:hypothetical protein
LLNVKCLDANAAAAAAAVLITNNNNDGSITGGAVKYDDRVCFYRPS